MIRFAIDEARAIRQFLADHDSFWQWDKHTHVAQLTSGKLSDFFANCSPIFSRPDFQEDVGRMLARLLQPVVRPSSPYQLWVVGSAMGAVGLAQALAHEICANAAFTEPKEGKMELKRFDLGPSPTVIICEDVMSTGGTTVKTVNGILDKHPDAHIYDKVPVVVDRRANQEAALFVGDRALKIEGLLQVTPRVWDDVSQLPPDMKNCVPIRPKGNWSKLQEKRKPSLC